MFILLCVINWRCFAYGFSGLYFLLVADKVNIHYFLLIGLNGVLGLPSRIDRLFVDFL